jgi:hypothetical protein
VPGSRGAQIAAQNVGVSGQVTATERDLFVVKRLFRDFFSTGSRLFEPLEVTVRRSVSIVVLARDGRTG